MPRYRLYRVAEYVETYEFEADSPSAAEQMWIDDECGDPVGAYWGDTTATEVEEIKE